MHDPLNSMITFLNEKRDKPLAQEWGIWLLKYDQEKAMRVCLSPQTSVCIGTDCMCCSYCSLSGSASAPRKAGLKNLRSSTGYRRRTP